MTSKIQFSSIPLKRTSTRPRKITGAKYIPMYEKEIKRYIESRGGLSALGEEEKSALVESAYKANFHLHWIRNSLKHGNSIYVEIGKTQYRLTPEAAKKKFPFKISGEELVMMVGKKEMLPGEKMRSTREPNMLKALASEFKIVDL